MISDYENLCFLNFILQLFYCSKCEVLLPKRKCFTMLKSRFGNIYCHTKSTLRREWEWHNGLEYSVPYVDRNDHVVSENFR